MNRIILDTEFVNLQKSFIYNLGYVVANENGDILKKRDFVIEQIWHNRELFATSYYYNKRNIYISKMRGKRMNLVKWGECVRIMLKDIKDFNINELWAYNVRADYNAINFMVEWYKTRNPLEKVNCYDIWDLTKEIFLKNDDYKKFCVMYNFITTKGFFKCTAETCYAFITNNPNYAEEHTALSDSIIETTILYNTIDKVENYKETGQRWLKNRSSSF